MRLGKPLPYNDNYNEGNGLRTGTYTVDHLKISTIVGEYSFHLKFQVSFIIKYGEIKEHSFKQFRICIVIIMCIEK